MILFGGDIASFIFALVLSLFIRYRENLDMSLLLAHIFPFLILWLIWVAVFFIAGLYEKQIVFLKSRLPSIILNALIANSALAVLFFYTVPYFGITPKITLFINLILSFALVLVWRLYGYSLIHSPKKQNAILIGSGDEYKELKHEVNGNPRYGLHFISSVDLEAAGSLDLQTEAVERIYTEDASIIAADFRSEKVLPYLPHLYNLIFSRVRFIDMYKIYEDIFDRIPLSLVKYSWFLENISVLPRFTYNVLKRLMDIFIGGGLGIISLIIYPIVFLAIKMGDGGPIWSVQERVGRSNRLIKLYKFRTMTLANDGGRWGRGNENQVTKVGAFLRKTRIDELPQLWNVLEGDISLIGPRPEFPEPVREYAKQVPYYNIRHLIKPGLSGWAQIHQESEPHHGVDFRETKIKLSYDLYYLKNRSILLDIKIALQTIRILLSRRGV